MSEGTAAFRCAAAARTRADPLVGSAPQARGWLLLEHPGPWPIDAVAGSGIDPGMLAALTGRAVESATRILLVRRPGRLAPDAPRRWILVGLDGDTRSGPWRHDDDLAAAAAALDGDQSALSDLGPILLVCTHGVHDTCCALRGRPVAAALAARWPDQVWECSHVGGDRFAPNVVVLPDGFYYGNLDPETAVGTVQRHLGGEVVVELPARDGPLPAGPGRGRRRLRSLRTARARRRTRPLRASGRAAPRARLGDVRRTGTGRRPIGAGRRPPVRRPEARLTCRAARDTPATEYRVEVFEVRPAG